MNFDRLETGDPTDSELLGAARAKLGDNVNIMMGYATTDGVHGCYLIYVGRKDSDKGWYSPVRSETRAGLLIEIQKASEMPAFKHGDQRFVDN